MKKPFLILIFFSTILWAQTNSDVLNQLDKINEISDKPKAPCPTCDKTSSVYGPADALKDINSGNLKFLGRDIFPGSDQNRTCAFKNDRAYVLYINCLGNRKEPVAMDIEVIPLTGGVFKFYVENSRKPQPISSTNRSDYDGTWTMNYTPSMAPGNLTFASLRNYRGSVTAAKGGCYTGKANQAQSFDTKGACYGAASASLESWRSATEDFWKNPPEEFYSTHKKLRKLVETAKF